MGNTIYECVPGVDDVVDLSQSKAEKKNIIKNKEHTNIINSVKKLHIEKSIEQDLMSTMKTPLKKIGEKYKKIRPFERLKQELLILKNSCENDKSKISIPYNFYKIEECSNMESPRKNKDDKLNNSESLQSGFVPRTKTYTCSYLQSTQKSFPFNISDCNQNSNVNNSLCHRNYLQINKKNISTSIFTTKSISINEINLSPEERIINNIKEVLKEVFKKVDLTDINQIDLINYLSVNFFEMDFEANKCIYNKNDDRQFFYILKKGSVKVNDIIKKVYNDEYKYFGEEVFFNNNMKCMKKKQVYCLEDISCYVLNIAIYNDYRNNIKNKDFVDKLNFVSNLIFLKHSEYYIKYYMTEKCNVKTLKKGQIVAQKDSIAFKFFIVYEGSVSILNNNIEIDKRKKGEYFGLTDLYEQSKRQYDAICNENSIILEINKEILLTMIGDIYMDFIIYGFFRNYILEHYFLNQILGNIILNVFKKSKIKIYQKNDIIKLNTIEDNIKKLKSVMIIDGLVMKENKKEISKPGKILGYSALYEKNSFIVENNYICLQDTLCVEIDIDILNELLYREYHNYKPNKKDGINPLNLIKTLRNLQHTSIFRSINNTIFEKLASKIKEKRYTKNEIIIEENTKGDYMYIIIQGEVKIMKDKKIIRYLNAGSNFGEKIFFNEEQVRSASVISNDNEVICYLMDEESLYILNKDPDGNKYFNQQFKLENDQFDLKDLYYIRFLGKGKFGNVYLVHDKKNIYAIKTVSRLVVSQQKGIGQYYATERKILLGLDHPFIVKFVKSLKNNIYCCFVLEYISGQSFSEYLQYRQRINKPLTKEEVKFYAGTIILALNYLHSKYIGHRDLKPNNIMLAENGYLKLIDFGTAKVMKEYTKTIIGTPHYIAPEILMSKYKNRYYSLKCDYWSLGICIYEMYYNEFPFGNDCTSPQAVYTEIRKKKLSFPNKSNIQNDIDIIDLLKGFLHKDDNLRLCNINDIKQTKFFKNFSWNDLENLKIVPYDYPNVLPLPKFDQYTEKFECFLHTAYNEKTNLIEKKDVIPNSQVIMAKNSGENWADDF